MTPAEALQRRRRLRLEQVATFLAFLSEVLDLEVSAIRGLRAGKRTLKEWIEVFYPQLNDQVAELALELVREHGEKVAETALAEVSSDITFDAEALSLAYSRGLADRWTDDSIAQLRGMLRDESDEEFEEALAARLAGWEESRAHLTAEREATQSTGAFTKVAFLAAGVERLVWWAGPDACPLCQAMNGRVISITRPFLAKGDKLDPEDGVTAPLVTQQIIGHPPLHGMGGKGGVCDCMVIAA